MASLSTQATRSVFGIRRILLLCGFFELCHYGWSFCDHSCVLFSLEHLLAHLHQVLQFPCRPTTSPNLLIREVKVWLFSGPSLKGSIFTTKEHATPLCCGHDIVFSIKISFFFNFQIWDRGIDAFFLAGIVPLLGVSLSPSFKTGLPSCSPSKTITRILLNRPFSSPICCNLAWTRLRKVLCDSTEGRARVLEDS